MDLAKLVWDVAVTQARAMQPQYDAHVQAYEDAICCRRCGDLFAPEQMAGKRGECIDCYAQGIDEARAEERDRHMSAGEMFAQITRGER